jgi:hypothetical protein
MFELTVCAAEVFKANDNYVLTLHVVISSNRFLNVTIIFINHSQSRGYRSSIFGSSVTEYFSSLKSAREVMAELYAGITQTHD